MTLAILLVAALVTETPPAKTADFVVRDYRFTSGEVLPELRLHYRTIGQPRRDAGGSVRNAVLILHGTTGSGEQFLRPEFGGELFGPGQPLDAEKFYIILPDAIGHGKSNKPSDGLRARFPKYGYRDMVDAQHRLVFDGLKVDHLRLVIGTSMGGMHTWLWGEMFPRDMDALMPMASLPGPISGRNRLWRRLIIDAIRNDPAWNEGNYTAQPPSLRTAAQMLMFVSSNPVLRQKEMPTRAEADRAIEEFVANRLKTLDANDALYAVESSRDYDPSRELESIRAPLLAINFADDLINPPELGILEREILRVKHGKALTLSRSDESRGHQTHTWAKVWKEHLAEFLKATER